jgi:hypothetical protein
LLACWARSISLTVALIFLKKKQRVRWHAGHVPPDLARPPPPQIQPPGLSPHVGAGAHVSLYVYVYVHVYVYVYVYGPLRVSMYEALYVS